MTILLSATGVSVNGEPIAESGKGFAYDRKQLGEFIKWYLNMPNTFVKKG